MSLSLNKSVRDFTESDLMLLISNGVTEDLTIDFKQQTYGSKSSEKTEFLKDTSAFAHARGGHIVLGMKEKKGVAFELCGLPGVDIGLEIERLTNMLRDGVQPPIHGVEFSPVALSNGNSALLIRVPRSWGGPHMVVANADNRYYIPSATQNRRMTVDELREAFLRSQDVAERLRNFHRARLEALMRLGTEDTPIGLSHRDLFAVHLIPYDALSPGYVVDLSRIHPRNRFLITPIESVSPEGFRYNADGFVLFRPIKAASERATYVQFYRNGSIEAVLSGIVEENEMGSSLPGGMLDHSVHKYVREYLDVQRDRLQIEPPIAIFLMLLNCVDARIYERYTRDKPPIDRTLVSPPEIVLNHYEDDLMILAKPALDALWNASDWEGSPYFDEDGRFRIDS